GLATVHGIVTSLGGAVTVYSELGKGSTFQVYLPQLRSGSPLEVSSVEPVPKGKESILFVDDEAALVRIGQQMLERLGYDVTARTSSVEALELFRARPNRFDLVITDMTMPNMTGVELAEELLRIRPDIPMILVTGFSEAVTPEKARRMGIREFIMKPIISRDLSQIIRRVLKQEEKEEPELMPALVS
ncbi:MAG: response regulator, partial [Calditrichaeota bacterium]|nr:response regulator [Calditrichota bacterium]